MAGRHAERPCDVFAGRRLETLRLLQTIWPPIGSTWVAKPGSPSRTSRYSAGLARNIWPSGSRVSRCRSASSSIAASISAVVTL